MAASREKVVRKNENLSKTLQTIVKQLKPTVKQVKTNVKAMKTAQHCQDEILSGIKHLSIFNKPPNNNLAGDVPMDV